MDEHKVFKNNNGVFRNDMDRMSKNFLDMTGEKMQTMEQFRNRQFRNANRGFVEMNPVTNEFYNANRTKDNVLMIDELLDNAEALNLTAIDKTDLNIRRNRVKDFELLNNRTKDDSREMTQLKDELRLYDQALSMAPNSLKEFQTFTGIAMQKCNDAIKRCEDYLKRGKSKKFWKSNRNERYNMVRETKARYEKDLESLTALSTLTDVNKFLREGDTMLDLLNIDKVNDRLVKYDIAQRQEREAREAEERQRAEAEARQRAEAEARQREEEQKRKQQEEQNRQQNHEEEQQQNLHQEEQQQLHQEQQQELYGTQELQQMQGFAETEEIRAIKTAISNIQTEMAKEMPAISLTADKNLDMKAERHARKGEAGMDAFCVKMVRLFARLYNKINDCLKTNDGAGYGGNDALKRILEQIQEQTKVDRKLFREKVVSFRSYIAGNEAEALKKHSWYEAWKYVRGVSFNLNDPNNGLETKVIGGGASTITLIKDTKKKERLFFRREENAGGKQADVLINNFMNSINGDLKCEQEVKDALKNAFSSLFTQEVMNNAALTGGLADDLDEYRREKKKIGDFVNSDQCTDELKALYAQASDEVKTEMEKALFAFAKKVFQYEFSSHAAKIDPNHSLTDRNVATSRLAGLLGISAMVSDSRTAVIQKGDEQIMGNVMENSRGKSIFKVNSDLKGAWKYSDKAISQLFTLQVFDMLCGQIDRHHGNYHVTVKDGTVRSVKAIDNDMSFGLLSWEEIEDGYQNISPLTECHVRSMPIDVINQILSLNKGFLEETLGDILEPKYIQALYLRLEGIQESIYEYSRKANSGLTINQDGKASFTGEDADDTLRMLKAVKKFRTTVTTGGTVYKINGDGVWAYNDVFKSLIQWDFLSDKDLNEKIEARKKELAQKK